MRLPTSAPTGALVGSSSAAALFAAVSWAPMWGEQFIFGLIYTLVVTTFTASGVFLLYAPGAGRSGWGMIAAAACYAVSYWWQWPQSWQVGPAPLIAYVFGYCWFVFGGVTLLRYPEPVLARTAERLYFLAAALWIIGGKLLVATLSRPEDHHGSPRAWWPTLADAPGVEHAVSKTVQAGILVLGLVLPVLLLLKIRRTPRAERKDAMPATAAAVAVAVFGSAYMVTVVLDTGPQVADALRTTTGLVALVAPAAIVVGLAQRRLEQATVAMRVLDCTSLSRVQAVLREELGDPDLVLAIPTEGDLRGRFVTFDGHDLPGAGEHPEKEPLRGRDGRPLALLLLSPARRYRPDLVYAAAVTAGIKLENDLLHDDLARQLAEVQASRRRITEAGLAERRRIERDLHDGAQQLLLAAVSSLSRARLRMRRGDDASEAVESAREAVNIALEELRAIARGIHPAALNNGLAAALESVVERLDVPVTLHVADEPLSPMATSTLYFVTCEALANVVRHARATRVTVSVGVERGTATATIRDDGRGGALALPGTGLAGLQDRVRAIRGELTISSPPGRGTTITARIPCE